MLLLVVKLNKYTDSHEYADDRTLNLSKAIDQAVNIELINYKQIYFSYFSTKTYVVGTQKNRLNETFLLGTQNICLN